MKSQEYLSNAKAIVAFLIFSIGIVIFYKFMENQQIFFEDINALRNYVIFAIAAGTLLITLFYLVSQTTHKAKASSNSSKRKRK